MNQSDELRLGGNVSSTRASTTPEAIPTAHSTNVAQDKTTVATVRPPVSISRRIQQKDFPDGPKLTPFQTPSTIENVEHMLANAKISVRYNVIKKKLEIIVPNQAGTDDNRDNVTMTMILSLASLNGMQTSLIPPFVEAIGDKNAYNPVADWISGQPWDGTDRLEAIYATVTARDDYPVELKRVLIKKWLLSAVAAALMKSGFHNRGVLTLQGSQGIGKTSWVLALVPEPSLRDQCVKVDHHLDSSNKDSILGAVTHWMVEIGELDSSFKKDIARLKGFLTSNSDKVRRPYARVDSEYQRRTVFIATVNDANFLVDTTGNSRWWTIGVTALNFNHGIDMQQLYAQLAVELATGAQWWLTQDEEVELALVNKPHESVSVVRETILAHLDQTAIGKAGNPALTASELLKLLGFDHPTNAQAKECGGVLRDLLGEPKRINGREKWRVPCVIVNSEPPSLRPVFDPAPDAEVDDAVAHEPITSIPGFPPTSPPKPQPEAAA